MDCTHVKVKMKHLKCGNVWETTPSSMLHQNTRCPFCSGNIKKTTKQFKEEIYKLFGNEYEVLSEYNGAHKPILMKHNKCGNSWEVRPANFLNYHSCIFCSPRSKGEDKITDILQAKNISFEREKRFDGCKNQKKLPFDFYLNDFISIIAFAGSSALKTAEPATITFAPAKIPCSLPSGAMVASAVVAGNKSFGCINLNKLMQSNVVSNEPSENPATGVSPCLKNGPIPTMSGWNC